MKGVTPLRYSSRVHHLRIVLKMSFKFSILSPNEVIHEDNWNIRTRSKEHSAYHTTQTHGYYWICLQSLTNKLYLKMCSSKAYNYLENSPVIFHHM